MQTKAATDNSYDGKEPEQADSLFAGDLSARTTAGLFLLAFFFSLVLHIGWAATRDYYPYLIGGDGVSYYVWLPSALLDGDLDFSNQYDYLHSAGYLLNGWPLQPTETGLAPNIVEVGPAVLWSPFFALARLTARIVPSVQSSGSAMGFGVFPHEFSIVFGTFVYGWAALILCYLLCRTFDVSRRMALISVLAVWLGSSFLYYHLFNGAIAHAVSVFPVALFLVLWLRARRVASAGAWLGLGCAAGLVVLTYISHAALVLPLVAASVAIDARGAAGYREELRKWLVRSILFVLGMGIVLIPQVLAWHLLYASILPPVRSGGYNWASPRLFTELITTRHGLLTWTPIVGLGLVGLLILAWRAPRRGIPLLAAFLGLSYINGIVLDTWDCAFGARRFIGATPLFVLGLGIVLSRLRQRWHLVAALLFACFAVAWNLLFLVQYTTGCIPPDDHLTFQQLVLNKWEVIVRLITLGRLGCG